MQPSKIGYLPLTFFSTSLLAFGPYWVPFQSLFSLWYFAGGEEWEKRVVRVSRAHVRTGGGHGPSAPRYHLHSPRPQLHPSLPLFRIWIFIGQPHVPFLYTSSSFIDLGTPIDPTIWMRIATSAYALITPFATQDKTCSLILWGGIRGGGRQNREKVESGFGVLGLEQPRKVLSGGDVKLQVLHVFSVLLWCGKEYFGVLWHDVIFALCVLLCGVCGMLCGSGYVGCRKCFITLQPRTQAH